MNGERTFYTFWFLFAIVYKHHFKHGHDRSKHRVLGNLRRTPKLDPRGKKGIKYYSLTDEACDVVGQVKKEGTGKVLWVKLCPPPKNSHATPLNASTS